MIHTIFIVIDGLYDEKGKSDVGVILGNKVNVDGSLSDRLIYRLDKGVELYKDSTISLIVVAEDWEKKDIMKDQKWQSIL